MKVVGTPREGQVLLPTAKLLWDSSTFDNNYTDMMPLLGSVRERGLLTEMCTITVMPVGDWYRVLRGRTQAKVAATLGMAEIPCIIVTVASEMDIALMRYSSNQWKTGRTGRNGHIHRPGY